MPLIAPHRDPRGERGFSMFLVVVAMLITSMFVAAAFASAGTDFSLSSGSKQRKSSYAAAEAGLAYYVKQLRYNPDFWAQCDAAAAPNTTEASPINQQWDGIGVDKRRWRKLPGVSAEYTIELLHTPRFATCDRTKQESLVDVSSGTFKVRVTGRATTDRTAKRSIVATFKREGFLKFVYFTDQENRDPQADTSASARDSQQANCVNRKRAARVGRGCVDISFASTDMINGPLHTNDESVLLCGSTTFGRETLKNGEDGKTDAIEVSGPAPGYAGNGCAPTPRIWSPSRKFSPDSATMDMPDSNQELVNVAASGGRLYSGKTIIRLKGSAMDVTNYAANGTATTTTDVPWPSNGVLYVANNGACNGEIPTEASYTESVVCGNAYVSGNYNKPLTIAAGNDVIIRPTVGAKLLNQSKDGDIKLDDGSDAVLGLIANNFVRVGHRVNHSNCTNYSSVDEPMITDVRIDAAIMSLLHSFMVDNYNCGRSGNLTVNGAIVQRFRGAVGTGSGGGIATGYAKDYWYDDRLRYRSPPYFLNPLKSKWEILRTQEQVPAR